MSSENTPRRAARLLARWQGVALTLVIGTATIWLAATGQLVLYIHPRYVAFTIAMITIGMVLSLLALAMGNAEDHEHDVGDTADRSTAPESARPTRRRRRFGRAAAGSVATLVTVAIAATLILLPPTTLTSATASIRGLGDGQAGAGAVANGPLTGGTDGAGGSGGSASATTEFTILQWANTLRQTSDLSYYENKGVDVTGFISPSPTDPDDTFVVTRFVITCCTVDAQPVGVTVYSPDWKSSFAKDDWVRITGTFTANPSRVSSASIALVPRSLTQVAQPRDPYLT